MSRVPKALVGACVVGALGGATWYLANRGAVIEPGGVGRLDVSRVESWPGKWSKDPNSLSPAMRRKYACVVKRLREKGYTEGKHYRVIQAWRSMERQQYLMDKGWSTVRYSYHTATLADGTPDSRAIDLDPFWTDDDGEKAEFYLDLWEAAESCGLKSGAAWSQRGKWAKYGIGWDPGHIELADVTIAQANKHTERV